LRVRSQGAGNFQTALIAVAQRASFVIGQVGNVDLVQQLARALLNRQLFRFEFGGSKNRP
jgi:hypothetical protein